MDKYLYDADHPNTLTSRNNPGSICGNERMVKVTPRNRVRTGLRRRGHVMSDQAANTAAYASSNVNISFRDGLTSPELRQLAERSVATLVARSSEAAAGARAEEAQRAKLMTAASAPLRKLIEADPGAVKALDEMGRTPLIALEAANLLDDRANMLREDVPRAAAATISNVIAPFPAGDIVRRVPPFDFAWWWHDAAGSPPFGQLIDQPGGAIRLEARSGLIEGGASGFVDAHAGLGVFFKPDRPLTLVGRANAFIQWGYTMRSLGLGSSATSEGGIDITLLQDAQVPPIKDASQKLWRRQVSGFEDATQDQPSTSVYNPWGSISLSVTPPHVYTYSVGVRVFSDRTAGIGGAAVQTYAIMNLLELSMELIG
jgi:hypothetical protein